METLKISEKFIQKEKDNSAFEFELISDGNPFNIPENAVVRLIVANKTNVLINKPIDIIDFENGIVQFVVDEKIGIGKYDCEVVVTFGERHMTFPTEGYQTFQINKNLEGLTSGELIQPTDYELLLKRIELLETQLADLATQLGTT